MIKKEVIEMTDTRVKIVEKLLKELQKVSYDIGFREYVLGQAEQSSLDVSEDYIVWLKDRIKEKKAKALRLENDIIDLFESNL